MCLLWLFSSLRSSSDAVFLSSEPARDGVLSARAAGSSIQRGRQTLASGPLSHPEAPRLDQNAPHIHASAISHHLLFQLELMSTFLTVCQVRGDTGRRELPKLQRKGNTPSSTRRTSHLSTTSSAACPGDTVENHQLNDLSRAFIVNLNCFYTSVPWSLHENEPKDTWNLFDEANLAQLTELQYRAVFGSGHI